jgi:hypothetical protein
MSGREACRGAWTAVRVQAVRRTLRPDDTRTPPADMPDRLTITPPYAPTHPPFLFSRSYHPVDLFYPLEEAQTRSSVCRGRIGGRRMRCNRRTARTDSVGATPRTAAADSATIRRTHHTPNSAQFARWVHGTTHAAL